MTRIAIRWLFIALGWVVLIAWLLWIAARAPNGDE